MSRSDGGASASADQLSIIDKVATERQTRPKSRDRQNSSNQRIDAAIEDISAQYKIIIASLNENKSDVNTMTQTINEIPQTMNEIPRTIEDNYKDIVEKLTNMGGNITDEIDQNEQSIKGLERDVAALRTDHTARLTVLTHQNDECLKLVQSQVDEIHQLKALITALPQRLEGVRFPRPPVEETQSRSHTGSSASLDQGCQTQEEATGAQAEPDLQQPVNEVETLRALRKKLRADADMILVQVISLVNKEDRAQVKTVLSRAERKKEELKHIKSRLHELVPYDPVDIRRHESICQIFDQIEGEASAPITATTVAAKGRKLPPLEKQTFSDDLRQWEGWHANYMASVHNNPTLDTVTKYGYLKDWTTGKAAKLIDGYPFTEANYEHMLDILRKQFGREDLAIARIRKEIQTIKPVFSATDTARMRVLLDDVSRIYRQLTGYKQHPESYEPQLREQILACVPKELSIRWYDKWEKKEVSFRSAYDALTSAVESLELADETSRTGRNQSNNQSKPNNPGVDITKTCLFDGKAHSSFHCTETLSIIERFKILDSQNKCRSCYKYGHKANTCRSGLKCEYCGGTNHSSMLCLKRHDSKKEKTDKKVTITPPKESTQTCVRTEYWNVDRHQSVKYNIDWDVLLPTVSVKLADANGGLHEATGMIDTGSQRSFITTAMALKLRWPVKKTVDLVVHGFGNHNNGPQSFNIRWVPAKDTNNKSFRLELLEQRELATVPASGQICLAKKLAHDQYVLADPRLATTGYPTRNVDFIIGMDQYYSVMKLDSVKGTDQLAATKSVFGWVISGLCKQQNNLEGSNALHTRTELAEENRDILGDFRQFWTLDHMGIAQEEQSEPSFAEKYIQSLSRNPDGRFVASLPWKENRVNLPTNRAIAERRLESLLASLKRRPGQLDEYHAQLMEYLNAGFIAEVNPNVSCQYTILPHRAVYREDALSTKCRPVFDGSSHFKGSPSVNDCLETGPNLNPELLELLERLRFFVIAWLADITKAFLQIELGGLDAHAIRFLWVSDPKEDKPKIKEYRWLRLPFGLSCSPFILRAVIKKLLDGYKSIYPKTVAHLEKQLYVDDWIGGADSVSEAEQLIHEANIIFASAKMDLAKWSTNSNELKSRFNQLEFSNKVTAIGRMDVAQDGSKALGVHWDQETDNLVFKPDKILLDAAKHGQHPTKRQVFSIALKVFDPLGLVSPVTLVGKLIMQRLWMSKVGWDTPVPSDILTSWNAFLAGLRDLDKIQVPRWVGIKSNEVTELQVFCDASEDAYATVIYVIGANGPQLLVSKTRIAPQPKRSVSIPRLELLSNLLGSKLTMYTAEAITSPTISARLWTDSTVAMHWIKGESGRWKAFVHNRVTEIRKTFSPETVNHCPGLENPADLASRGTSTIHLATNQAWWNGPHWLAQPSTQWPTQNPNLGTEISTEAMKEAMIPKVYVNLMVGEDSSLFSRYDRFDKLYRTVAWLKRFKNKCLKTNIPDEKEQNLVAFCKTVGKRTVICALSTKEIIEAQLTCIRMAQAGAYPKDYHDLIFKREVATNSPLSALRPVMDGKEQVIRVTGRIARAYAAAGRRPPILLPAKHALTKLILRSIHRDLLHAGVSTMLVHVRRTYFTSCLRSTLKKIVSECVQCRRFDSRPFNHAPALLPLERVLKNTPFGVTGVDFAGPLKTVEERVAIDVEQIRGEVHICLFTCAVTRAIHLEVVKDLRTETFIFALRRFIARRGIPKVMYSDNAGTFTAAAQHLRYVSSTKRLVDYLNGIQLQWKFSASLAPWWGGFWERLVQSVKRSMYKTLGREVLTYEQFITLTTEIESVINNRPLTYVLEDDLEPISPARLLSGRIPTAQLSLNDEEEEDPAAPDTSSIMKLRQIEHARRETLRMWWELWEKLYLEELDRLALKHGKRTPPIERGQVVLIHDEHRSRVNWHMGRVVHLFKGKDGKVRKVKLINVNKNTLVRPIQRLYPLEAHAGQIDDRPHVAGRVFPPEGTPYVDQPVQQAPINPE